MATIAGDSFYAKALPPTDDAARYIVDSTKKGHTNLSVYNTSQTNSAYWNGYIKRAIDGSIFNFATNDRLFPGQHGGFKRMANLSNSDEIHVWGDSSINCFIDGGLEG